MPQQIKDFGTTAASRQGVHVPPAPVLLQSTWNKHYVLYLLTTMASVNTM
jgi:hypothetical protein